MERIKQIDAIQPGDLIYYGGELVVVQSTEIIGQKIIIKTDSGAVIEESTEGRLEVFRMKNQHTRRL